MHSLQKPYAFKIHKNKEKLTYHPYNYQYQGLVVIDESDDDSLADPPIKHKKLAKMRQDGKGSEMDFEEWKVKMKEKKEKRERKMERKKERKRWKEKERMNDGQIDKQMKWRGKKEIKIARKSVYNPIIVEIGSSSEQQFRDGRQNQVQIPDLVDRHSINFKKRLLVKAISLRNRQIKYI